MTWGEYLYLLEGWQRTQDRELRRWRRAWFNALWGPHVDPKRLPSTEAAYFPLEGDERKGKKLSEASREKLRAAIEKYNRQKAENGREAQAGD